MARQRTGKLCQHKKTGVWYMNHKGRRIYFSKDKKESRRKHLENVEAVEAGEPLPHGGPKQEQTRLTTDASLRLRDGLMMYLEDREHRTGKKDSGLRKSMELLVLCCGGNRPISELGPDDFTTFRRSLDRQYMQSTISYRVCNIKSAFKWLYDNARIEHLPRYGSVFKSPSRADLRLERQQTSRDHGSRSFSAEEIRRMLNASQTHLQRCALLLGINCGFGQTDCVRLEFADLDLKGGWYDSLRAKKGAIPRRARLWDVTVKSLNDYVAIERMPSSSGRVFAGLDRHQITRRIVPVILMANCKRDRMAFYGVRHSFEEFATAAADQQAVDRVMGHAESGSARYYREGFDDARLQHVADVVYRAVFGETVKDAPET